VSTNGEQIPPQGYGIAIAVIVSLLVILFAFYFQRWLWISKWRFTTRHGVACYFEKDCIIYDQYEIEEETDRFLDKWATYYISNNRQIIMKGEYIKNSTCLFKKSKTFTYTALRYWKKMVYGVAGFGWAIVGQGGRGIEKTAFKHEMSHVHINRHSGYMIPEEEAHKIFEEIGI
jgi:hypothetical protein